MWAICPLVETAPLFQCSLKVPKSNVALNGLVESNTTLPQTDYRLDLVWRPPLLILVIGLVFGVRTDPELGTCREAKPSDLSSVERAKGALNERRSPEESVNLEILHLSQNQARSLTLIQQTC